MKIIVYCDELSPHQLPFVNSIADISGLENVTCVYHEKKISAHEYFCQLGDDSLGRIAVRFVDTGGLTEMINDCDVFLTRVKDFGIIDKACEKGIVTYYSSERWFRPPFGMFRLLRPSFLKGAFRLYKLLKMHDNCEYLAVGKYAAADMLRMCGLFSGDLGCLFCAPAIEIEKKPMGAVRLMRKSAKFVPFQNKVKIWGYFVEPSQGVEFKQDSTYFTTKDSGCFGAIRIMWIGRMIRCKRVDILIKAVKLCISRGKKVHLDLYGDGVMRSRLQKMTKGFESYIKFRGFVPFDKVRGAIRDHDVLVLSSNAREGWGATVNEALAEHVSVIATRQSGSGATILPESCLYNVWDTEALADKICQGVPTVDIGKWDSASAARAFIQESSRGRSVHHSRIGRPGNGRER